MNDDMTPQMWKCLEWLAKKDIQYDLRQGRVSDFLMAAYHALEKKGYVRIRYSDGDRVDISITDAGKEIYQSR
jgi:hypothetical protein